MESLKDPAEHRLREAAFPSESNAGCSHRDPQKTKAGCPKPVLSRVFKAFHYREFRLMWFGACTSSIGTWMQVVAQQWLVFSISKSAFMLGLDGFLGQIPIVLFSLIGGVIADRIDRRRVLLGSQYVQMTCAFVLTLLIAFNLVKV